MTIDHAAARFVNPDGTMTQSWYDAMKELGICSNCGSILTAEEECDNCEYQEEDVKTHYHVVEFINGCLNDYDSGPIESLEDARDCLSELAKFGNNYKPAGVDRYERGIHILKIEECREVECEEELHGVKTDFSDLPFVEVDLQPFYFRGTTNEEGEVYGG